MIELKQMTGTAQLSKTKTETVYHDQDSIVIDGRWVGTAHRTPGGPIVIHRPGGLSDADIAQIRKQVDERDGETFPDRKVRVIRQEAEPEWLDTSRGETGSWI